MCCKRNQTNDCHYEDSANNEYRSQNAVIKRLQREKQEASDQRALIDADRQGLHDQLDAAYELIEHQSSRRDKTMSLTAAQTSYGSYNPHANFQSHLGCRNPPTAKPEVNRPSHESKQFALVRKLLLLNARVVLQRFEVSHISQPTQESVDWPAYESAFAASFALGVAVCKSHDFGGDHERIQRVYEHFQSMQSLHPTHEQLSTATSKLYGFCYNNLYEAFRIGSPPFGPVPKASCVFPRGGIDLGQRGAMTSNQETPGQRSLISNSNQRHRHLSNSDLAQALPKKLQKPHESSMLPNGAVQENGTQIEAILDAANTLSVKNRFMPQQYSAPVRSFLTGPGQRLIHRRLNPDSATASPGPANNAVGDVPHVQVELGNRYDFSDPNSIGLDTSIEPLALPTLQSYFNPNLTTQQPLYPVLNQGIDVNSSTTTSFSSFTSEPATIDGMLCDHGAIVAQAGHCRNPDASAGY